VPNLRFKCAKAKLTT